MDLTKRCAELVNAMHTARIAGFSIRVSDSDFICCGEECTGFHGWQAFMARRERYGPARAKQTGSRNSRDVYGAGLVAAQHVQMRVILTHRKADMAAGPG